MAHILSKKQRLISKKKELNETWDDVKVFISHYIEKMNYVVDAVLGENNSVVFFQTYPEVSCNMDKVLNIFLQVQCKLNIFSCEDIFNSDYKREVPSVEKYNDSSEAKEGNRQVSDLEDASLIKICALEEVSSSSEIEQCTKQVLNSEDLSVIKVDALGQDLCDSTVEVCPAAEWAIVENCAPLAGNDCETKKLIVANVQQSPSAEIRFECGIRKDSREESCDIASAKGRISHCVIKSNEVLEMVYSHGDSPWNFWLCYYPCSDMEFLQKRIRSMYYTNKLEVLSLVPQVGDHVLVADGKRFFRGQVLTVRGTDLVDTTCVMILDLDSGRMKSFKLRHVWKIPEELMSFHAQAVNCQLQGVVGDSSIWSKENLRKCRMEHRFEEMLQQTTLSVKFIRTQGDSSLLRYIIDADCINLETDKIFNVSQLVNDTIIPVIMQGPDVKKSSQEEDDLELHNQSVSEIAGNILSVTCEYGAETLSLCGTSYSDAEDIINTDLEIKVSDCTDTGVIYTEDGESGSSVTASIYCSRDIILEKRNYSDLLNKTVVGVPTIVDSPSLFCMQFVLDANDEFADLHKKMENFYSENKINVSSKETAQNMIKSLCAAMYPQDGKWYRAEIIEWQETSVCVCFVDIGDKMVIELDLIQPLAKQFAEVPILSQRCHLYAVAPVETAMYSYVSYEWLGPSLSLFRNILTSGHLYTMQVKEVTSYGSVGVVLIDPTSPDTSINEQLIALGEAKHFQNEENLSLWDPMKAEYERCARYSYNDEDACEAVTGYSPNDEQRFCKFYARNGRCFKGSNCRKEHVLSHPGGWISDKEEVFQDAFSQIMLPEVGETVFVQVTCVIRINLFYIVLVEDSPEEETLLTLNMYINDKDNIKNLRKLEVTPAVGQLVLAHYHQDGIWYRARVIDTDNDSNLVQVFFVDYGNTEWVNEMYVRDIDPQYLHLPFQAIESSLAFADMNASVDDDSLETVISVFRCLTDCTQPLKAKIISKDDVLKKLELQLYDVNNHDIALMLSDTGYVSITSVQMTPATTFGIPG